MVLFSAFSVAAEQSIGSFLYRVHHGDAPGSGNGVRLAPIARLLSVAHDGCFMRGNSEAELRQWAESEHGSPASPEQLKGFQSEYATLIGGWTLHSELGAIAVIQSALKEPVRGAVCSLTAELPTEEQYKEFRAEFEKLYSTTVAEEADKPDQRVDRYWINRAEGPPVKVTIVYTRSVRIVTIRMIHGNVRPLGL